MQVSIVMLTNEYGTLTVQIPSIVIVKLDPSEDDVQMLSDHENNVCTIVDIFDTSPFSFGSTAPKSSKCQ